MPFVTGLPEDAETPNESTPAGPPEEPDLAAGRRPLPRRAVPWLVFTVALVIAGSATLVQSGPGTTGWSGGSQRGPRRIVGCLVAVRPGHAEEAKDYCDRYFRDVARRSELTQPERDALAADQERAEQALRRPGWCVTPPPPLVADCARRGLTNLAEPHHPGPADVQVVRQALDEAGFTTAVVRLARPNDPAMNGSIFFVIPLGEACFVGYMNSLAGGGGHSLVGRLPNGHC
jgi:hypothetical protein